MQTMNKGQPVEKKRKSVNLPQRKSFIAWICIGLVVTISLLDFVGWTFGLNWLKDMGYVWPSMKVVTSFCFLVTSLALIISFLRLSDSIKKISLVIAGIFLVVVGSLTIISWSGTRPGLPGIFANVPVLGQLLSPDHMMSLLSAVIFSLIGVILILLASANYYTANFGHILLFPVSAIAFMIPASYLLGALSIHDFYNNPVALNSGISFCATCIAIYLVRTDTWIMKVFAGSDIGGIMARRLIPWVVLIPIFIGWLHIFGEQKQIVNSVEGVVFMTAAYIFCFILLIWIAARSLTITDNKRLIADENLQKSYDELESRVKERTAELINLNQVLDIEIKERINAEKNVIAERKRLEGLLEMIPAYIILLTPDYQVAYSNKYFRERFGASGGRRCYQFLFNRSEPCETCESFKVFKENKEHEWEWTGPDGHIYSIYDFPYVDSDGSQLIMEMGIDITSLKEAEANLVRLNVELEERVRDRTAELYSANQQLSSTQKMALLGSWELDVTGAKLRWDEATYDIFGLSPKENNLGYESFLDLIHPDDRDYVNRAYMDSIRNGRDTYEVEHRIIKRDTGEIRYLFEKCNHIRNIDGQILKSVGMVHDITDHKLMDLKLQKTSERNEILSQTAADLLASKNPQDLISSLGLKVMKFLDCQIFFNFLLDDKNGRLHLNSYAGIPEASAREIEWLDIGVSICGSVVRDGVRVILENIPESNDCRTDLLKSFGIKSYACHPILSGGRVIGTVSFGSTSRISLSEEETSMMKDVTDQVAIAMTRVRNEESIRKSEERYRRLMELSPGASYVNRENKIVMLNSAACKLLGAATAEEIIGKSPFEILHPDSHQMVQARIEKLLKGESVPMEVEQIVRSDGSIKDVEVVAARIDDEDGPAIQVIMIDITDRINADKALKESKEKLEIALENGNIGIWEWDIINDRIDLDKRSNKIFSLDTEFSAKSLDVFEKIIHEEDLPYVRDAFQLALTDGNPLETIFRIRHNDDNINYISIKALVKKDIGGKPLKMTGVCFDITEMKKGTERALFLLNENLLRSNKDLEQFAYVASHDLQEPLRMVSSFTQLLSKRYHDKLDKDAQEFIQFAVDGAIRMQLLINGLLEYSRVETRGNKFSLCSMQAILGQVIFNLNIKIAETSALITSDELPVVLADERQIVQLLQNLIDNAIKFCKTSPRIHISALEENHNYLFSVSDNGIGIEPQYFTRVFQIFQRLHSKEEFGGTGIGLAICKRIIDRHGGKIWIDSSPGKGSVFYFTIRKQ